MPKSEKPVAIITGGSRGVGEATAKLLASKGWNVTITCTSTIEDANEVVEGCKKSGVEGLAIKADVSDDEACKKTIEETVSQWGRIDSLVNNAGTTKFVFDHSNLEGFLLKNARNLRIIQFFIRLKINQFLMIK